MHTITYVNYYKEYNIIFNKRYHTNNCDNLYDSLPYALMRPFQLSVSFAFFLTYYITLFDNNIRIVVAVFMIINRDSVSVTDCDYRHF